MYEACINSDLVYLPSLPDRPLRNSTLPPHPPPPPTPPLPPRLQQRIRQRAINHRAHAQPQHIQRRTARLQPIQAQHILARLDRAPPIGQPLALCARKCHALEAVRRQVRDDVLDGAEVVHVAQENRHVDAHDAGHDLGDRQENAGDVDGEPRVLEQRVKHDAERLAAADDAEAVEGHDEEQLDGAREPDREDCQNREDQAGHGLERHLDGGVLHEERFHAVRAVVVLAREDVALERVDSDVLEHADEVDGRNLLEETDAVLHAVVVVFQWREEERQDDAQPHHLHDARNHHRGLSPEVEHGATHQQRVGDVEGRHAAPERAELGGCGGVGGGCAGAGEGAVLLELVAGPALDEAADFGATGSFFGFVLEVDGDEVEGKVGRVRAAGALEALGCKVWQHVLAWTGVDREASAGKEQDVAEVAKEVGSGLVDCQDERAAFFRKTA